MRIGLVVYGGLGETSGGFRYDRKLVEHLRDRGDDVEVLALPWRTYPRHLLDSLSPSVRRKLDRPFDVLLQDELCHPSLWRHTPRLERPDAVVSIVHHLRSAEPERRVPVVARAIERRYLEGVDGAIFASEHTRTRAKSIIMPPIDDPDTVPIDGPVVHPCGRCEGAALTAERVSERSRTTPFRVLFVGALTPRKGLRTLLEGVSRLEGVTRLDADRVRNSEGNGSPDAWELTVVGRRDADPDYARSIEARARSLGIADRVTFRGELSRAALEREYERSHAMAVPSTYEGFGMVYLEAMEYGVVPIASSNGGASEVVTHGENGFLVAPNDPEAVARTLSRLRDDRDRLAAMGLAGLETADAHPTWAESMAAVRSYLADLVGARSTNGEEGPMDGEGRSTLDGGVDG